MGWLSKLFGSVPDPTHVPEPLCCPRCFRVYRVGHDAGLVTNADVLASADVVLGEISTDSITSEQEPALVGHRKDGSRPDLGTLHQGFQTGQVVAAQLAEGKAQYWSCSYCKNDDSPFEFPDGWVIDGHEPQPLNALELRDAIDSRAKKIGLEEIEQYRFLKAHVLPVLSEGLLMTMSSSLRQEVDHPREKVWDRAHMWMFGVKNVFLELSLRAQSIQEAREDFERYGGYLDYADRHQRNGQIYETGGGQCETHVIIEIGYHEDDGLWVEIFARAVSTRHKLPETPILPERLLVRQDQEKRATYPEFYAFG